MKINSNGLKKIILNHDFRFNEFLRDSLVAFIENYEAQQARLAEAEECIRFYADDDNFERIENKIIEWLPNPPEVKVAEGIAAHELVSFGTTAQSYLAKYCKDLSGEE